MSAALATMKTQFKSTCCMRKGICLASAVKGKPPPFSSSTDIWLSSTDSESDMALR
eukprot:CAMPEP_0177321720 /NCGR_PEP_ID=MMETSP0368-20130122/15820_1 /TAXON_ID=447022 ORGANISM="Scrippsiella hangoei-like, Strain SHHI-4" /NCGR_SAMPLE_ID=MMETSP0368 /ASSEMBLY_ACC=CAM_ASM_000363 /LENGTH=55 /DNA_ID=CAMNT_0018781359 /DNA_START=18 /DNA_END=181 /DNA_ORIENTATION=-